VTIWFLLQRTTIFGTCSPTSRKKVWKWTTKLYYHQYLHISSFTVQTEKETSPCKQKITCHQDVGYIQVLRPTVGEKRGPDEASMTKHVTNFTSVMNMRGLSYQYRIPHVKLQSKHSINKWILSWVYGSMTTNEFWIGWLDLLTASLTISRNHNQLQPFFLDFRELAPCSFSFYYSLDCLSWTKRRWLVYPLGRDHAQKTQLFYFCVCVCWGSHVITTQPVNWPAGCCLATISAPTT
jgi:hypothetical protein